MTPIPRKVTSRLRKLYETQCAIKIDQ